jgi:zinc transporter
MAQQSEALEAHQKRTEKPVLSFYLFDGKGGVRQVEEAEAATPAGKGFVLVAGNVKAPAFQMWLKNELGAFNADLMTVQNSRSRCTVLDDKAHVVLRVVRPGADPEDVGRQLLSMWLEKGRVTVASELNIPEFLGIATWEQVHHAPQTPADLLVRLGLRAADRLEPLIERLGDRLDHIEEHLLAAKTTDVRVRLAELRRTLINFRRMVWPLRDVLNTLEIEDVSFLTDRDRIRLREAAARASRLGDELQALSERAVLVHEQILDTRAEQMNRTMVVLTAVTVILLPLTVISGMLGMNVAGIPFADQPWAFGAIVGGLVLIALLILFIMHKAKWL